MSSLASWIDVDEVARLARDLCPDDADEAEEAFGVMQTGVAPEAEPLVMVPGRGLRSAAVRIASYPAEEEVRRVRDKLERIKAQARRSGLIDRTHAVAAPPAPESQVPSSAETRAPLHGHQAQPAESPSPPAPETPASETAEPKKSAEEQPAKATPSEPEASGLREPTAPAPTPPEAAAPQPAAPEAAAPQPAAPEAAAPEPAAPEAAAPEAAAPQPAAPEAAAPEPAAPEAGLPAAEAAGESGEPSVAMRSFEVPSGSLSERLGSFADWTSEFGRGADVFVIDSQGYPLVERGADPDLLAAALLLSDASQRAADQIAAARRAAGSSGQPGDGVSPDEDSALLQMDLGRGASLSVIMAQTRYGVLCVGLRHRDALPNDAVNRVTAALAAALEGPQGGRGYHG